MGEPKPKPPQISRYRTIPISTPRLFQNQPLFTLLRWLALAGRDEELARSFSKKAVHKLVFSLLFSLFCVALR